MFFSLSGFLVAGSLERSATLISFAGLRVLRLLPALCVETVLSACVLGPWFTTLPLDEYFSAPEFHSYFLNIFGLIHYTLPGVFNHNIWGPQVNQQLWTLPYEMECYIALAALVMLGIFRRTRAFCVLLILVCLAGFISDLHDKPHVVVQGRALVLSFLIGVAIYRLRSWLPFSWTGFSACLLLGMAFLAANGPWDYIAPLPIAYATVFLGLCCPPRLRALLSGDYSYGIFLYGFPIQQSIVYLLGPHSPWTNAAISLPITSLVAFVSWHIVEKRALLLKRQLIHSESLLTSWACNRARARSARQLTKARIRLTDPLKFGRE